MNFQHQLPPNQTLFCKAPLHDETMIWYASSNSKRKRTIALAISGCTTAQKLYELVSYDLFLSEAKIALVSWGSVSGITEELTALVGPKMVGRHNRLVHCGTMCLTSPCCTGFAMAASWDVCHLLMPVPRNDHRIADVNLSTMALFQFGQRTETRPALHTDARRLIVEVAPTTVLRLFPTAKQSHRLVVRLAGEFGATYRDIILGLDVVVSVQNNGTVLWKTTSIFFDDIVDISNVLPFPLDPFIGQTLTIELHAEEWGTRTIDVPVVLHATNTSLQYLDAGAGHRTVRGENCASLLRGRECCFKGLRGRQFHFMFPEMLQPCSSSEHDYSIVHIELSKNSVDTPCIEIIDGHIGHWNPLTGFATFDHLVLRSLCSDEELVAIRPGVQFLLFQTKSHSLQGFSDVPLDHFVGCSAETQSSAINTNSELQDDTLIPQPLPILLSMTVHESPEALRDTLHNIHNFVPDSIILLHVSLSSSLLLPDMVSNFYDTISSSKHQVLVNPSRFACNKYGQFQGHLSNLRYMTMVRPDVLFSHIVFLQSNEVFVKRGLEHYVRQFDLSCGRLPDSSAGGFLNLHAFIDFSFRPVHWIHPEDHGRFKFKNLWDANLPYLQDFTLALILRQQNISLVPHRQIYLEGAFFNLSIALELLEILKPLWEQDGQAYCISTRVALSELVYGLLQRITKTVKVEEGGKKDLSPRCGDPVTTMLWNSGTTPPWVGTINDVRWVRCSPFSAPFGFKRVPRDTNHPVRRFLQRVVGNWSRLREYRDSDVDGFCSGAGSHN